MSDIHNHIQMPSVLVNSMCISTEEKKQNKIEKEL